MNLSQAIQPNTNNKILILDGGMGSMLQQSGLSHPDAPELLCQTNPEAITAIHRAYIDAGAQVIYANTFGANSRKLPADASVAAVVRAALACAKDAAEGREVAVALDIGPIGEMLEPSGSLTFEAAYEIFKEIVLAGTAAGADLIVCETLSDLYETKAAVLAAKENSALPLFVTMSFEQNGRTFVGASIDEMVTTLEALGVDALGINCSLGPVEMLPVIRHLAETTHLPILIKPNAGLPDPETGAYHLSAQDFAETAAKILDLGVSAIGGCCGTTPEYIRAVVAQAAGRTIIPRTVPRASRICSGTKTVTIDGVRIIGERLNPTGKKALKQALAEGNTAYILEQALSQVEAGAHILDVNVGVPGIDEAATMRRIIKSLQSVVDTPLQIDSSKPAAIEAALRVYNGKPIVNSVNGEARVLDEILPLVKKYGAAVVGLTLDEQGIPEKAEDRCAIAERILNAALSYGIAKEDVYIDCLTLTASAQQSAVIETLKALRMVKEQLGLKTVLGVSNISFGLPDRELLNHTFLTMALACGLDLPIMNPNALAMTDAIDAVNVFTAADRDSVSYIERHADARVHLPSSELARLRAQDTGGVAPVAAVAAAASQSPLEYAILKGLTADAAAQTAQLLQTTSEMEIIDQYLIPALDVVGARFEAGTLFLPQLLQAAQAAQSGFEVIRQALSKKGAQNLSKGKIIVATVHGDIHDIGKNIVKVILQNYGYTVIDLGKNVPPEEVVAAAIAHKVPLVGLSALMTTTLDAMAKTIQALKAAGLPCKTVVGGAVLTADYAKKIGADYYAKDAKETIDAARDVFSQPAEAFVYPE